MPEEPILLTPEEREKIEKNLFSSFAPLVLKSLPPKVKKKRVILQRIAQELEPEKHYDDKEINALLQGIYSDYVTLRRELIDFGLLDRTSNGREYWLK